MKKIFLSFLLCFLCLGVCLGVTNTKDKKEVVNALVENNFPVSVSKIKGKDLITNKYMILVATTSKKLPLLKKIIMENDDHAFIVVSENKYVVGGYK